LKLEGDGEAGADGSGEGAGGRGQGVGSGFVDACWQGETIVIGSLPEATVRRTLGTCGNAGKHARQGGSRDGNRNS
jgi:hypothetical protein